MAVEGCLFVAISDAADGGSVVKPRLGGLRAFYRPLGLTELAVVAPSRQVVVGWLGGGSSQELQRGEAGRLAWGEPLPPDCRELLAATDGDLRKLVGMTAAAAWRGDELRIVNSPSGPATLYEASSADTRVFATH